MNHHRKTAFPVIRPFLEGVRFVWWYKAPIAVMALLPFLCAFALNFLLGEGFEGQYFWAVIAQIPVDFSIGIFAVAVAMMAQIHLRSGGKKIDVVTRIPQGIEIMKAAFSQKINAVFAFTVISYFMSGIYAGMTTILDKEGLMEAARNAAAPQQIEISPATTITILGMVVLLFFLMRFMWLYVFITLKHPLKASLKKMRGMEGSLLVGVLFFASVIFTKLVLSIVFSVVLLPFYGVGSPEDVKNVPEWIQSGFTLYALVISYALFSAASVFAVTSMLMPRIIRKDS